jgi:uncharacterized protein (DUF1499 family)
VAGSLLVIFLRLENWKRDLTSNRAQLDAASNDPSLRPLALDMPIDQAADHVERWVASMSNWNVGSIQASDQKVELQLTRRTRVFGFFDDVLVRLTAQAAGGTSVDAESQSRFGKGDLGQNPRNLRELRSGLQQ